MKRSWIPAVIVFAGALALGNFVLVPLYCRGGLVIPYLERAALCAAETSLTRSASLLLYFGAVALALFAGIIADRPLRRAPAEPKKAESEKSAEPVEPAAVVAPTPSVAAVADAAKSDAPAEAAKPDAPAEAPKSDAASADASAPPALAAETPRPDLAAMVEAALKVDQPKSAPVAPTPVVPKPAPMPSVTPVPAPAGTTGAMPPPPKPTPLVKPWQKPKAFDGTNEELIARFKELGKAGGVEAIATAQRNLDESTLSALASGVDPKQHLSQIAHLLLMDDPELKSEVSRGVVVHIAARLKELGVVANLQPGNASSA